jgi:hypothetical protein
MHMATIVNNPGSSDSGAVAGLVTAIFVVVALGLIAFFVWPGIGSGGTETTNVNVEVPALDTNSAGTTQ